MNDRRRSTCGCPRSVDVHSPVVRWITVPDAAAMLGLSIRQTTALAPKLGGRKAGKRWMLPVDVVLDEVEARSAAYSGRTELDVA